MKTQIVILENIHEAGIPILKEKAILNIKNGLDYLQAIEASKEAEVIIVKSVTKVDKNFIDNCPRLKIIARAGTGLDNIDVKYANQKNISVYSVPTGNTNSAAEFAVMQIINLSKNIFPCLESVKKNDFRRSIFEGREISGLKIGIFGIGNVGINVAKRLHAFGANLYGYDPHSKHLKTFNELGGQVFNNLEDMVSKVEVLTLHSILSTETKGVINFKLLQNAKKGLKLVNTARGGLIVEDDLIKAINENYVSAAAVDVVSCEPPFDKKPNEHNYTHPFLNNPNIIVTPHLAASTVDAQRRIAIDLANQIINSLQ